MPKITDTSGPGAGAVALASGNLTSCAVPSDGVAECWGSNSSGQLGTSVTTSASAIPVDLLGLGSAVTISISGGGGHSCAVTKAGAIKCWGYGMDGQLGSDTGDTPVPVGVVGLGGVPTRPTSVVATAGNAQAGISWTASSTGGTR